MCGQLASESLVFRGQPVAIIRSIAEKIHSNVEKVLVLAQDIQQPGVELRHLDCIWRSGWEAFVGTAYWILLDLIGILVGLR